MYKCVTNKPGKPCGYMGYRKCMYANGCCFPVVKQCDGCNHIETYDNVTYCSLEHYSPWAMWLDRFICYDNTEIIRKENENREKYINNLNKKKNIKKKRKQQKKK